MNRPPESAKRPLGAVAPASLSLMTLLLTFSALSQFMMPPPCASLATVDNPDAEPTRFPLTVVFATVRVPQLSMPPPAARANGQGPSGQGGPNGTASVGATRLPVITLLEMATFAPALKLASGGISTPPPGSC